MLKLNDKLRKERKKTSEKLFEKIKEKAGEKKEVKEDMIYLNDTDIRTIIEAVKKDHAGKANTIALSKKPRDETPL